jgi:hypothetical protein
MRVALLDGRTGCGKCAMRVVDSCPRGQVVLDVLCITTIPVVGE